MRMMPARELRQGGVAQAFLKKAWDGLGSSRNHAATQEFVAVINHRRLPDSYSKDALLELERKRIPFHIQGCWHGFLTVTCLCQNFFRQLLSVNKKVGAVCGEG
jgi:hypothetical protein